MLIYLIFLSAGCSLLKDESFSCSLNVLYGGLGISKLQFLIKKRYTKLSAVFFSSIFGHQKPVSGLDPDLYPDRDSLEMLDPDPNSMNPDPQH